MWLRQSEIGCLQAQIQCRSGSTQKYTLISEIILKFIHFQTFNLAIDMWTGKSSSLLDADNKSIE